MKKAIGIMLVLAGLIMMSAPMWLLAADTYTSNYGFIKVDLDSEDFNDPWGAKDHRNWDAADAGIAAVADSTGTISAQIAALNLSAGAIAAHTAYITTATARADAFAAFLTTATTRLDSETSKTGAHTAYIATATARSDAFAAFLTTATTRLDSETSKTGAHTAYISTDMARGNAFAAFLTTATTRLDSETSKTGAHTAYIATATARSDAFAAFLATATTRLDAETSKTGAHTAALSTAAYQNGNHSFASLGVGSMTVTGLVTANAFVGDGTGLTGLPGGGDAVRAATQTFTGANTFSSAATFTSSTTMSNTLEVRGGIVVSSASVQTVLAANGTLALSHGLGTVPSFFTAIAINVTGELGYSTGLAVSVGHGPACGSLYASTTVLVLQLDDACTIVTADTAAAAAITLANWKFQVKAWK